MVAPAKPKSTAVKAVLVKLSISIFPNTRQDRDITEDVKTRKALGSGAGKWVKYKLPDECLTAIRKFCGEVRQFHYNHTTPWDEGARLLSGKVNEKYSQRMAEFKSEFDALVEEFIGQYPNWVEHARIMHANTFEPSDYPSKDHVKSLFAFGYECFPVPKPEHFNSDMKELYGQALVTLTEKKIGEAVSDTWDRLMKPVFAMAEKLSSPDAIFRDTLVENVKEMVELVPSLNLTEDPKLVAAAKLIEQQLASLDVNALRENKVVRADTAKKAAELAARFGGLGKRKLATN